MRLAAAISRDRFQAWPFAGPVIIRVTDNEASQSILVDKWCLLGTAKSDNDEISFQKNNSEYLFDVDTYKILLRYISNKNNQLNIHPIVQADKIN